MYVGSLRIYFLEVATNSTGVMQPSFFGIGRCYRSPHMHRLLPANFHSPQNNKDTTFPFSGCPPPWGVFKTALYTGHTLAYTSPFLNFLKRTAGVLGAPITVQQRLCVRIFFRNTCSKV